MRSWPTCLCNMDSVSPFPNSCWRTLCQPVSHQLVVAAADSSFVPPLVYAALGTSRHVAIGPVAVVSLLLGDLLKKKVDPKKHPAEYLQLALTATFYAGVLQAILGIFR